MYFFNNQTNLNLQMITMYLYLKSNRFDLKILARELLSVKNIVKSKHLTKEGECSDIDSKKRSSVSQYMSSDF